MKNIEEISKNSATQMMKAWDWAKDAGIKAEGKAEGAYTQVKAGVKAAREART